MTSTRTSSTLPPAIVITGLRKAFGDKVVLDDLNLTVTRGTVYALLGPNGAGKTTTVNILSTLLVPDAGSVRINGHDPAVETDEVRAVIGVTGQFSAVDNLFTGAENLKLMGDLNHLGRTRTRQRAKSLLERFDLTEAADKPAATYSGGMRRRLDLAMTLMGDPKVIFLDEPTTGLDPRSRRDVWQIVRDLVAEGVTIFLTTQYLEEADELADRVAVLDHGHLIAEGTPDELKRRIPGGHLRLRFANAQDLETATRTLTGAVPDTDALALRMPGEGSGRALRSVLDLLDRESVEVTELTVHTPDLDDVFLTLTGQAKNGKQATR